MLPLTIEVSTLLDSTTESPLVAIFAFIVVGYVVALIVKTMRG